MRNLPGWAVGALGAGVVAAAFVLGGRLAASDLRPESTVATTSEMVEGLQLECEPGQRAVLRQARHVRPGEPPAASMACVSTAFVNAGAVPVGYAPAATAWPAADRPLVASPVAAARPAVVRQTTTARAPLPTTRSTKKSVAIIAASTATGAVVGGVVKGKKGAAVGGIVAGAAATVWDQVTRKKG